MKPAFSDKITINSPITEVFSFISDISNGTKLNTDVVEVVKLTEGPISKGTKFKEVKTIRSRRAEAFIEVAQYEPSKAFSARSDANGLIVTYHYQMNEEANGTQVSFQCEVQTSGIVMALTKPLIIKILKREDGDHLKNIKRVLETTSVE
jgi:carbon monoxide dehydrogenase subunit G